VNLQPLILAWLFFAAIGMIAAARAIRRAWADVRAEGVTLADLLRSSALWDWEDEHRHDRIKLARARLRREVGRISISTMFLLAGILAISITPSGASPRPGVSWIQLLLVWASAVNSLQSILDEVVENDLRK